MILFMIGLTLFAAHRPQCHVEIVYGKKSGIEKKVGFDYAATNKTQCEKLANSLNLSGKREGAKNKRVKWHFGK